MRFKNIDFLRFLFAALIIMFHGHNIINRPQWLSGIIHCNVCVDFFFIIAGFFLFYNFKPDITTWEFAKKRFLRLVPNLWLSIILLGISSIFIKNAHWNLDGNILTLLMLNCVGVSPSPEVGGSYTGVTWFISSLFWTSIFYFYISKIFEKKYLNLIIWLIVMFSYAIYMQHMHFGVGGQQASALLIYNIGTCRALASMGLGYFLSMAYKSCVGGGEISQEIGTKGKIFISLCECFIVGFLFHYMILSPKIPGKSGIVYIVLFAILFYLMLIQKGIISKLLNNNILANLGKYSYSIYCFQIVVLTIFKHHIFKNHPNILTDHPLLGYFGQSLSAIIAGILLYYIFERPITKYINKKFLN